MSAREDIIRSLGSLPCMPAYCGKILGQLKDPKVGFEAIGEALQYDPGITANLIRYANSAVFGRSEPVGTIKDACVRLGTRKTLQLIVARSASNALNRTLAGYDLRPAEFLQHSVWVAVASEDFCQVIGHPAPGYMFTAGLLHDIGKLALDPFMEREKTWVFEQIRQNGKSLCEAESEVLGIDHAEAGAKILSLWKFPAELVMAARWHHDPEKTDAHAEAVHMVHLANVLADSIGIGVGYGSAAFGPSERVLTHLKLKPEAVEGVASRTLDKMRALQALLGKKE